MITKGLIICPSCADPMFCVVLTFETNGFNVIPYLDALGEDDIDYPAAPVWERRKLFGSATLPKQGDLVLCIELTLTYIVNVHVKCYLAIFELTSLTDTQRMLMLAGTLGQFIP